MLCRGVGGGIVLKSSKRNEIEATLKHCSRKSGTRTKWRLPLIIAYKILWPRPLKGRLNEMALTIEALNMLMLHLFICYVIVIGIVAATHLFSWHTQSPCHRHLIIHSVANRPTNRHATKLLRMFSVTQLLYLNT